MTDKLADGPAVIRASMRALVPATSADAVTLAAGNARPGPLRRRRPAAANRISPSGRVGVPVNLPSPRKTPSAAKPGTKAAARSAGMLRMATVKSSVGDTRPFASITPCRSPKRRWSRARPLPNPMRAGPSKCRFSPFQVACRVDNAATRVWRSPFRPWRSGDYCYRGCGLLASALSRNASSGPASPICTEAPMPLADFAAAMICASSTGWVSGSTIVVVSSARPVGRNAGEPDILSLHTQIRALMPTGFRCNQIGGDRPR